MKFFSLILFLFVSLSSFAQLEYVETYNPSTRLIYIDKGEPAIMVYDKNEEQIELYSQDQSLISSITIPYEYEGSAQYNLFHVSRRLFDCDSTNIEYLISRSDWDDTTQVWVKILRDDGTELFGLTNHTFWDNVASSSFGVGLIQVDDGVLIKFHHGTIAGSENDFTKIYKSTCGTVPGPIANNQGQGSPDGIAEGDFTKANFLLFPNPGEDILNVDYELPDDVKTGQLSIYDAAGQMIYEKQVGSYMNQLIVNVSEWTSGRYEVILRSPEGGFVSNSYIKVKAK